MKISGTQGTWNRYEDKSSFERSTVCLVDHIFRKHENLFFIIEDQRQRHLNHLLNVKKNKKIARCSFM